MAIKVLIVDDSAVVRQVLTATLEADKAIGEITVAPDPIFAQKKMANNWPDVIILDIEMPRMDGLTFLRKIMQERPTPVVICSSLTESGAEITMHALEAGAVSIISKPKAGVKRFLQDSSNDVITAVKSAAQARMRNIRRAPMATTDNASAVGSQTTTGAAKLGSGVNSGLKPGSLNKPMPAIKPGSSPIKQTTDKVVAIGTSTGGTQALERVLTALPAICPGIVIVQHMPEKFTAMFAARLDSLAKIHIREAKNGDSIRPGLALIAPGGRHLRVKRDGGHYRVEVFDGPVVNHHKPSVDVMFKSVAQQVGSNAVGFIFTGMGDDGARGLLAMREAGAKTIAQDEASCVVFGMPKEAIEMGAAERVLPLDAMPSEIMKALDIRTF